MITGQLIQSMLEELRSITRIDLCVCDLEGHISATTFSEETPSAETIRYFVMSEADSQVMQGYYFFKVMDESEPEYVLIAKGSGEDAYMIGKITVCELQNLMVAYKERYDKSSFIQNILLDNLLLVDIYNRAKKLRIECEARRVVIIIETKQEKDSNALEIVKTLYAGNSHDFVVAVDEKNIILVKEVPADGDYAIVDAEAHMLLDMLNAEAMSNVRVAYGTIVSEIHRLSKSYKEAKMALDVGKIFYEEKTIIAYNTLGIGRLIYQLPMPLCEMFMDEVFEGKTPEDLDEETLTTINRFFENSLNVSETARQLYIHRNTLVYRLEKLQRTTGLDIRDFEEALTFRIALMVNSYMKHMKQMEE
ncbi:MAG: helix-turn-helix domain-containing protein [Eubacteriales bacterium]|nr:helix-turn-helix domain-containing protein [Eubacteriales bacterium]